METNKQQEQTAETFLSLKLQAQPEITFSFAGKVTKGISNIMQEYSDEQLKKEAIDLIKNG